MIRNPVPIVRLLLASKKLPVYVVMLLPFIIYFNTIFNDYALDDSIVITENIFVKKGFSGIKKILTTDTFTGFFKQKKGLVEGGRYRPLSVATFAIEYELWGLKPGVSHFINILLYSVLCLILFKTLQQILTYLGLEQKSVPVAFLATLVYAVHPVHTEVVANLKGRDELLAVLFLLLSLLFFIRYISSDSFLSAAISGIMLFIALLSKENALTLIPIVLLILLLKFPKVSYGKSLLGFAIILSVSFIYSGIRLKVVGGFSGTGSEELMNNPFLHASNQQKTATIFYTLLLYLKLLIFPHPLTYDYYPYHIVLHSLKEPWVIISIFLQVILIITGIVAFRKNHIVSLGILFYFITILPVSNLLVNIGSFMNERFLFLPSIGFAVLTGAFIYRLFSISESKKISNITLAMFILILITFSVKSMARNTHWKNNYTLFTHDIKISANSAKGNCTAGGILLEEAQKTSAPEAKKELVSKSMQHLNKALAIYPQYVDALLLLGNAHYEVDKNIPEVILYYNKLFLLAPDHEVALNNLKKMLAATENANYRKKGYKYMLSMYPDDFDANYQLGITYGKMLGQLDSSKIYLKRALILRPDSPIVNRDLGVACAMKGEYAESLPYFKKALTLDPGDPDNYINLGITYQNLGRLTQAKAMFEKAGEMKKSKN